MHNAITLYAKQLLLNTLKQKSSYFLWIIFLVLIIYAAVAGKEYVQKQNEIQYTYQQKARQSWENNPNKHPHRMAHFGSFAMRVKHSFSVFDFGMDNYAGNAVFLEAHKQNTINYNEASFSSGLLRMGDLSIAMLLQILLPLIIFFLGFRSIAQDRETGTLKIVMVQNGNIFSLLIGRSIGLWLIAALFFIPSFIIAGYFIHTLHTAISVNEYISRFLLTLLLYSIFFWVIAVLAVATSAWSTNTKSALLKLLTIWLVLAIILPKMGQGIGSSIFGGPSKIEFEAAIEKDILQQGDSHNPDDPFFKKIKDSVFKKYGVTKADSLPVNLGGIIGKAGEKLSAETYNRHQQDLMDLYNQQNSFAKSIGWINPFILVKYLSMALAGSDFQAYNTFQRAAEQYRYDLAQKMNDLQIELIANVKPKEGSHVLQIDKHHWNEFKDFTYPNESFQQVLSREKGLITAILMWLLASFGILVFISRNFKIIV